MATLTEAIKYTMRKVSRNNVSAYAAQSAFFIFLSLFPALMLVISLCSRIVPDIDSLLSETGIVLPGELLAFLNSVINDIHTKSTSTMSWLSTIMLVWSASMGINSLYHGLELMAGIPKKHGYFMRRLLAVPYTVLILTVLVGVFLLFVVGDRLISIIFGASGIAFIILRPILGYILLSLLLAALYRFIPGVKRTFKVQLCAGAVAAFGWIVFSYGFQFYVDNFAVYSTVYGSITAVILLMLWLYACMYMLFVGAVLAEYFDFLII